MRLLSLSMFLFVVDIDDMTAFLFMCVDVMVMSYEYDVCCSVAGSCGMSDVYMLKIVGERTF